MRVAGEYIVAQREECALLLAGVSYVDGAAIGTAGMASLQSIMSYLEEGGDVFINGKSCDVGTFGIQFARVLGAKTIVTSCSASSQELCTGLGATEIIDYRNTDVAEILRSKGELFGLVGDFIGLPTNLYKNSNGFLKPGGQYVLGLHTNPAGIASLISSYLQPGFLGGGKRPYLLLHCQSRRKDFELIGRGMADGMVKAVIDSTYKWDAVPEAFKKLKGGRAKGKIVVLVREDGQ